MKQAENNPAFKILIVFAFGILTGAYIKTHPLVLAISFIIPAALYFIAAKKMKTDSLTNAALFILIFLSGNFKASIDFQYIPDNSIRYLKDTDRTDEDLIIGIIKEPVEKKDTSRLKFIIECESIVNDDDTMKISGDAIVHLSRQQKIDSTDPPPFLEPGDRISMFGKISMPPAERNPGEFDYRKYLEIHGIYKMIFIKGYYNVELISKGNINFMMGSIIFPAREYAEGQIDKYIGGDEGNFLKGLVTGERSEISKEIKENFVNAGVMHLIAVSGLNVVYVILFLTLFFSLLRIPAGVKNILIILALIFYIFFAGASASIVRASIMGILYLIARMVERKPQFYNIIAVSALVILSLDSRQLLDTGFILSYSATISMVFFVGNIDLFYKNRIQKNKFFGNTPVRYILASLTAVFAAQLGTMPLTSIYFGKISIVSFITNIAAVPLSNLSLAIGFLQIILSLPWEFLGSVAAEANFILLKVQLAFINYFGQLDFAYTTIFNFTALGIIIYYSIIIFLFTSKRNNFIARLAISGLAVIFFLIMYWDSSSKLKVTFIDTGQSDCTLIETPDKNVIMVDCGLIGDGYSSAETRIAPYLRRNGISKIDLLILTHSHSDHIGGIPYLADNFEIGKILSNGESENNSLIEKIDSVIAANKIIRQTVREGDIIKEESGLGIYFLYPKKEKRKYELPSVHTDCLVFILKYGEADFLFCGDVDKYGEAHLVEGYNSFLKTDVLKVAHHGSLSSTSIPFIVRAKPEFAVIPCGINNRFNHPNKYVINRLRNVNADILRTDYEGAIIFESDGKQLELIDWK